MGSTTVFHQRRAVLYYRLEEAGSGTLLYYNRDFYCVKIHDKEVACDGILFHNVYEIPVVPLTAAASAAMQQLMQEVKAELAREESSTGEMLRILLKQLIIRATRLCKQHLVLNDEASQEAKFARTFSQLVKWHYARHHAVADYAALRHLTPKALSKRLARHSHASPNDLIKGRIMLKAKRLLAHTQLSMKKIGYKLGYEDTSYFIRLFTKQAAASPQTFRLHCQPGASRSADF